MEEAGHAKRGVDCYKRNLSSRFSAFLKELKDFNAGFKVDDEVILIGSNFKLLAIGMIQRFGKDKMLLNNQNKINEENFPETVDMVEVDSLYNSTVDKETSLHLNTKQLMIFFIYQIFHGIMKN